MLFPALVLSVAAAQVPEPPLTLSKAAPAQETVASKTSHFATISGKSPELKKAIDSKDLAAGLKLTGKIGAFTGTVSSTYSSRNHAAVYIDFSEPWKNSISGQVLAVNFSKFPILSELKGKRVLISGKFNAYRGTHPEVEIKSLKDIKIVK